jgi:hypothetical protein
MRTNESSNYTVTSQDGFGYIYRGVVVVVVVFEE